MAKFEEMSTKMKTIDDIKGLIDSKVSEMKRDIGSLSKRVSEVELSQTFISKTFEVNSKKAEHKSIMILKNVRLCMSNCAGIWMVQNQMQKK